MAEGCAGRCKVLSLRGIRTHCTPLPTTPSPPRPDNWNADDLERAPRRCLPGLLTAPPDLPHTHAGHCRQLPPAPAPRPPHHAGSRQNQEQVPGQGDDILVHGPWMELTPHRAPRLKKGWSGVPPAPPPPPSHTNARWAPCPLRLSHPDGRCHCSPPHNLERGAPKPLLWP